jgi:hypothetical protein
MLFLRNVSKPITTKITLVKIEEACTKKCDYGNTGGGVGRISATYPSKPMQQIFEV